MHLAVGVAGGEQAPELGGAVVVEALGGHGEELAAAVERVVASSAVAEGVLLHPPPRLVDAAGSDGHDVERVGDGGGVGQVRR